jgi:glycosyltransferase involved in cell wall biosynthesis
MKQVSVVIPTYNRVELLPRTIEWLRQQTGQVDYEVVFIINGANDGTRQYLEKVVTDYPSIFRVFYIDPTGGPSAPRNIGIAQARGEVVIILDDDVIPDPDLVFQHWRFHQEHPEPQAAALGEVYVPEELRSDPMSLFHAFPYDEVRRLPELNYLFFWTCNVSVKRDFMLRCGMFDESMLYYEDMVCGYRLYQNGMQLRFLPQARGRHMHKLVAAGVPKKGIFSGMWLYRLVQCVPDRALKERFGIFSPDVRATLLFWRGLMRLSFRIVDNPVTAWLLRALGAERTHRNRVTDFYYYLVFRRNMLAGYYQAKRGVQAVSL